jgi:hypothetical protein
MFPIFGDLGEREASVRSASSSIRFSRLPRVSAARGSIWARADTLTHCGAD